MTHSGSGWTETKQFNQYGGNNGGYPSGGVILDAFGNLYGTNSLLGAGNGGVAYELLSGSWTYSVLYPFQGGTQGRYWASQFSLHG